MRKYSKKSKGAAVLEPESEAPIIECDPLEPEEVGIRVYIFAPKHSKSFRKLAEKQFLSGVVKKNGAIKLSDGQTISAGSTCKTEMTPALKIMLRDGVFLAGKAPRKE